MYENSNLTISNVNLPIRKTGIYTSLIWSNKTSGIADDCTTCLLEETGWIKVDSYVKGNYKGRISLIPEIKNIKKSYDKDGNPVFVAVQFWDNTTETAKLHRDDAEICTLEQGLSICVMKKVLSVLTYGYGSSVFNKLTKYALKKNIELEAKKEEEIKAELTIKRKRERLAAKKKRRKERQIEEKIQIQKEAYLRAMKEMQELKSRGE